MVKGDIIYKAQKFDKYQKIKENMERDKEPAEKCNIGLWGTIDCKY